MKYLIHTNDSLDSAIGEILTKEISRFDIRAEITQSSNRSASKKELQNSSFDVLIVVGSHFEKKLLSVAKKSNIRSIFLYQSIKSKKELSHSDLSSFDLTFHDLPNSDIKYFGNPLLDVIKSGLQPISVDSLQISQLSLIRGFGAKNSAFNALSGFDFEAAKVLNADLERDIDTSLQVISRSNVAITTSNVAELVALYLNCPSVRINKQGFFKTSEQSLINQIAGKNVIQVFGHREKNGIKEELSKVLNDHNYCAGIMQDYQEIKDLLGIDPAIRKIANYIVDCLEED